MFKVRLDSPVTDVNDDTSMSVAQTRSAAGKGYNHNSVEARTNAATVDIKNALCKTGHHSTSMSVAQTRSAAGKCYNRNSAEAQVNAAMIDIKNALCKTGHHSTFQHAANYLAFDIENIPVSLATFGLHLTHPFYNSSQRSGRYCLDMFDGDSRQGYIDYIKEFLEKYCDIDTFNKIRIIDWFLCGFDFFHNNIDRVTELVKDALIKERPHYKLNIEKQARRIAQEQLRVFISTIVPTGMIHTINLTALYAMYASAWNTPLKALLCQMVDEIRDPLISEAFESLSLIQSNQYTPPFECTGFNILSQPVVNVWTDGAFRESFHSESNQIKLLERLFANHNVLDTLHFDPNMCPKTMSNFDDYTFESEVKVPVVTFGQDQRHRMIMRSLPTVTGDFYVSELIKKIPYINEFATKFAQDYMSMANDIGTDTMIHFIPYGSIVSYSKRYDMRAYAHCIHKRLCFNAEATIWKMEDETVRQLYSMFGLKYNQSPIGPPCKNIACPEGNRFCGKNPQSFSRNLI